MPFEAKPTLDAITNTHDINAINTNADQDAFGYGIYNHNVFGFGIDYAAMYPAYINIFGGYNQEDSVDFNPLIQLRPIMPCGATSLILGDEYNHQQLNNKLGQFILRDVKQSSKQSSKRSLNEKAINTRVVNRKPAKHRNAPKRHQNNPTIRGGSAKPGKFKAKFR
ncbi:hypothetical protein E24_00198 [Faustovirus]|nr:hypothetical protein PRJ_Fausto_00182 [Faustovirus]AMN83128.1 hypothetical protein E24_00198 [Faustovirus]AMN84108.1 hypothetical protein D5a_00195 [Faustovirus]AMN85097.1 hypothetical protein E23_00197 [Faustovirus]QBR99094.1 hypothetical protein [Faustovirus mariensis]